MKLAVRGVAELVALGLAVFTTIWVSRIVGPRYFGYLAVTTTLITLGSLLANAGMSTAGSQQIVNGSRPPAEIWWAVVLGRVGVTAALLVIASAVLIVCPLDPTLRSYLAFGLAAVAFVPLRVDWLLVAEGRLGSVAAVRVVGAATAAVAAVVLIRSAGDYEAVPFVPVSSAAVTSLVGFVLAGKTGRPARPRERARAIRQYLAAGRHYLKSDIANFVFSSSDRLFLYAFATPAIVGLYEAAYRVIQPFYAISSVVGDTMYRRLATTYGGPEHATTMRRYVDLMLGATAPLGLFLLAFSDVVVAFIYGPAFAAAAGYLSVLGWVITVGYAAGVAAIPFTAWNRPRDYGNAMAIGGVVNLVLNVALIPGLGGLGAAWATVAAKAAVLAAAFPWFRRATQYPLAKDIVRYTALSFAAYASAVVSAHVLGGSAWVPLGLFLLVYVFGLGAARWRPRGMADEQR